MFFIFCALLYCHNLVAVCSQIWNLTNNFSFEEPNISNHTWVFVAQAKSKWVVAELRVQTVYKRKPHHHVVWLCTSSDFLKCSFQRDPPAYLLTPLDKGICQVDYEALWWYMCLIPQSLSCFIPPRYPGMRSHTQSVSGNVLAFGIRITEASQMTPLLRAAVDFAFRFRLVLQDQSCACPWL